MQLIELMNETFGFRDGERIQFVREQPTSGRWIAVQARSISMPKAGDDVQARQDGKSVEQSAIIACERDFHTGKWKWLTLSAVTKERISDQLFDSDALRDCWYFVTIEDLKTVKQ